MKKRFLVLCSMTLLIPILMIVVGSFASIMLPEESAAIPLLSFIGNKNLAMLVGVLCSMLIARPYIPVSYTHLDVYKRQK